MVVEGTTVVTVLRRDRAAERAALCARATHPPLLSYEERHLYVDVKTCLLEHITCERGSKCGEGVVTPMRSWSMRYIKIRSGGRDAKWENKIQSFVVNGEELTDPESQFSFVHTYWTGGTHGKCHVLGNALAERIASDDALKTKLYESTWTTRWLHHGLLYGTLGPLTTRRWIQRMHTTLSIPPLLLEIQGVYTLR